MVHHLSQTQYFFQFLQVSFLQVAWDVDTIYFSHDSHELALADFEHLDQRDLICIISALEHNTWFHKLTVSPNTTKLNSEVVDRILSVVAKSVSLQVSYPIRMLAIREIITRILDL
jgi:hypothetical protein